MLSIEEPFELIGLTLPGSPDPAIAIASARGGRLGILDCKFTADIAPAFINIRSMDRLAKESRGIKLENNLEFKSFYVLEGDHGRERYSSR